MRASNPIGRRRRVAPPRRRRLGVNEAYLGLLTKEAADIDTMPAASCLARRRQPSASWGNLSAASKRQPWLLQASERTLPLPAGIVRRCVNHSAVIHTVVTNDGSPVVRRSLFPRFAIRPLIIRIDLNAGLRKIAAQDERIEVKRVDLQGFDRSFCGRMVLR